MNTEDKLESQEASEATPRRAADPAKRDSLLELGEIKVIKPLRMVHEDPGDDPYNHTGRFTRED